MEGPLEAMLGAAASAAAAAPLAGEGNSDIHHLFLVSMPDQSTNAG